MVSAATQTFDYTGSEQSYVVPSGVTSVLITAEGAGGGDGSNNSSYYNASHGAVVSAVLSVTPGENLAIYVGGMGGHVKTSAPMHQPPSYISVGGFNGGGIGANIASSYTGGGGGASDVRQGGNTLAHRVLIAGGGGGAGSGFYSSAGGNAGETAAPGSGSAIGGGGATQTEGGAAGQNVSVPNGTGEIAATAGSLGQGGNGGLAGVSTNPIYNLGSYGGGGGGGGLFGGGGGGGYALVYPLKSAAGGGGAGSSYANPAATNVHFGTSPDRKAGRVLVAANKFVSTEAELRQAILAGPEIDTITLAADIILTGDLPPLQKDLLVEGANHTLDGAGLYRLFYVQSGDLTVHSLEFARGSAVIGNGETSGSLTGDLALALGANVSFDRSDKIVYDGVISGDGSVTQSGTGTLALTTNHTFTGNLIIDPGSTVDIGNDGMTGSVAANIVDNGRLVFSKTYSSSYAGVISGTGSVSISSSIKLTGANTYSGGTQLVAGSSIVPADLLFFGTGPTLLQEGNISWAETDTTDISLSNIKITEGTLNIAGTVRFANPVGDASVGGILKYGEGTLVLAANNAYAGTIEIRDGKLRLDPGAGTGPVVLKSTGTVLSVSSGNTLGSLTWNSTASLRLPIGSGGTPLAITGELALHYPYNATPIIDLIDEGVVPGQTYTLLTFGSTSLIASQFLVTGAFGTLSVEPHALKFTADSATDEVPHEVTLGVAMTSSTFHRRAVFNITNTGNTASSFQLLQKKYISGERRNLSRIESSKLAFEIVTTLNGTNVSKLISGRGANIILASGERAQIVVKIKTIRKIIDQRTIRLRLGAICLVDRSKTASAQTSIFLKAQR